ncbi:unnamed protein product, partial [Amoebophrya sp. A25]|eukprot:GSA25T00018410001.1
MTERWLWDEVKRECSRDELCAAVVDCQVNVEALVLRLSDITRPQLRMLEIFPDVGPERE